MMSKKIKIIAIGIGIICFLGVGGYGANSAYKNYQEKQIEQAKEQQKNEQIEQAKEKVKKVVDDKISNMDFKAEYDLKNSSDIDLAITVTLDGRRSSSVDCKFNRADGSVEFDDYDSFENALNKYVNEEKIAEIRHTVIYDYQDILYGMASKMPTWDKVKLSQKDDDYTVQETTDRFFGGDKAYLVIVDSQWISKNGYSEWKQVCLHMEYDKDNKLIDAKYGDYDKIDPDKDIKNGADDSTENKEIVENNMTTSNEVSNSQITPDEARKLILKEDGNYISKVTKKDKFNQYSKLEANYKEYSAENMPTRNGWDIPKEPCYEFCVNYYNNKGQDLNGVCVYLVGKQSKKIYCIPNQGGMPAYQIENNQKVKTFKWIGEGSSSGIEWH